MPNENDILDFLVDKVSTDPHHPSHKEDAPPVKKDDENTPPPAKKEEKKVEQLREVAKQRDEIKQQKEALEKEVEDLRKFKETASAPQLKRIEEYIKNKFGVSEVDDAAIDKFIEKNRKRKKEVEETSKLAKTQEEIIKDLDIDRSLEFNEKYKKPLATHAQSLFAELASVDNEGKVKHGPIIEDLYKQLLSLNEDNTPLTPVQIKGVLAKFSRVYHTKTGEEYEIPNITNISNSINSVHVANAAMMEARKNWSEKKKQSEEEKRIQAVEHQRKVIDTEIHERTTVFNKVISEFDFSKIEGVIEKDKVETAVSEAHKNLLDRIQGKATKAMPYEEYLNVYAKGAAYDDLVKKVQELTEENNRLKENGKNNLGLRSTVTQDKNKPAYSATKSGDPLDFVR